MYSVGPLTDRNTSAGRHDTFQGQRIPITQIVWLKVTCPQNGSISSFCREFARQLDRALGVDKFERMYSRSKVTRDELEGMIRQHCATYFVGLLVIDEIQRLDLAKTQGAAPLLDFFQDLRDHLKVPSLLIGTYKAVRLFQGELKDARRASESGLIDIERPSSHLDEEWVKFVKRLWTYQWTKRPTVVDDDLLITLYELTQGITDILVILFKLAQQRAMFDGTEAVTVDSIRATYDEHPRGCGRTTAGCRHALGTAARNRAVFRLTSIDRWRPRLADGSRA